MPEYTIAQITGFVFCMKHWRSAEPRIFQQLMSRINIFQGKRAIHLGKYGPTYNKITQF